MLSLSTICLGNGNDDMFLDNKQIKIKTIPSSFESIPWNQYSKSSCTPEIDWLNGERGFLIAAPTKVITQGQYHLPLCGTYVFSKKFLNKFKHINSELTVVVVDAKTHRSYSSNLTDKSMEVIAERSKAVGTDEELEKLSGGSWFNIDVYYFIESLPKRPAKYIIYALLGDQKSNVVEVEVVDRE